MLVCFACVCTISYHIKETWLCDEESESQGRRYRFDLVDAVTVYYGTAPQASYQQSIGLIPKKHRSHETHSPSGRPPNHRRATCSHIHPRLVLQPTMANKEEQTILFLFPWPHECHDAMSSPIQPPNRQTITKKKKRITDHLHRNRGVPHQMGKTKRGREVTDAPQVASECCR